MILTYRVTLEGLKGFFRVYKINSENSLYTFHKQLRSDLEFTVDQPILFKAFDAEGGVVAKYALIDLGYGSVDMVRMSDTLKAGVVKFVYFYDVASKKSVNITLELQEPGTIPAPTIVETKGPLPIDFENGYVAFEDLPEDQKPKPHRCSDPNCDGSCEDCDEDDEDFDDDDEEEDDEDREEEELIYDNEESA